MALERYTNMCLDQVLRFAHATINQGAADRHGLDGTEIRLSEGKPMSWMT
jgi:hypothetical protein